MYNPETECKRMIERIEMICLEKEITHNTLAKRAGISNSTLSYLLSGKSTPYVYTVLQICNALDVTIEELLGKHTAWETRTDISEEIAAESYQNRKLLWRIRRLSDGKKKLLAGYLDLLERYTE